MTLLACLQPIDSAHPIPLILPALSPLHTDGAVAVGASPVGPNVVTASLEALNRILRVYEASLRALLGPPDSESENLSRAEGEDREAEGDEPAITAPVCATVLCQYLGMTTGCFCSTCFSNLGAESIPCPLVGCSFFLAGVGGCECF